MVVGLLTLDLHVGESQSLKEKRMIMQRLKDALRRRFNVAVAEVGDDQDTWQRTRLGIAGVGQDRRYVNGQLSQVVEWMQSQRAVELTDYELAWW